MTKEIETQEVEGEDTSEKLKDALGGLIYHSGKLNGIVAELMDLMYGGQ
jgi:hypothetical protein